jgi:hypothetical protein
MAILKSSGLSEGRMPLTTRLTDAQGDYIAHLDDDDELLPNYLETLVTLITR